jgi:tight adherence protein C
MNAAMSNSLPFIALVAAFALAMASIVWVVVTNRQRRTVLRRATGAADGSGLSPIRPDVRSPLMAMTDWLAARVPAQLGIGTVSTSRLVHAGFDSQAAGPVFALLRIGSVVTCVALAFLLAPASDPILFGVAMFAGIAIGVLAPTLMLDRLVEARTTAIRRAIPDALDLLVVCVEAGIALDASVQRVARELFSLHPILADELSGMSRRISAGMPRDQAMHALYLRTGVDELRGLASHMLQSEKWGTSISTVLRMYSEQLRIRRRMVAEKRAATASTRMLLPLILFIFPTLFVVLLGPALMRIATVF